MLAFGLYLQHVVGLEPCPMCVVQRYALVAVALFTGLASAAEAVACVRCGWCWQLLRASAAPSRPPGKAGSNGIRPSS